jgi:FKBP-type peptidyl-prolyl cis-trans isomerase (trigger factor)
MQFTEIAKAFSLKSLPESEVELVGEVPYDALLPYREKALVHMAEHLEMPGFRPGKVPTDMALKKVGEVAVLEEAVEMLVKEFYPELVTTHTLDAVGRPDIRITKLAPGNPVGLTIRTTVYPKVEVHPSWKTLHETVPLEPALPASDEEVAQTLENIRQSRKQGDVVPELTDEFAKAIGAFENVDALKVQVKKGISEEKVRAARDVRRGKLIEALLEKTPMSVPRIFIESEQEKILAQMREDVQKFGTTFEDYLKRANKTEDGIRNEFREQATKRAKLQLILNKLAEEEKIETDEKAVETEMKHALEHFPDAKPGLVRIHIETVMSNEKVLQILEAAEKKA